MTLPDPVETLCALNFARTLQTPSDLLGQTSIYGFEDQHLVFGFLLESMSFVNGLLCAQCGKKGTEIALKACNGCQKVFYPIYFLENSERLSRKADRLFPNKITPTGTVMKPAKNCIEAAMLLSAITQTFGFSISRSEN